MKLLVGAIWKCYNGREAKVAPGRRGHMAMQHEEIIGHVPLLLVEAIWRCYNGCEAKAVPGIRGHVLKLLVEAIWRFCNGHEAKAVPAGTS